jgi:serine/threonine protein kinase
MTDPRGLHRVDSRRWQHTTTGEVFGTMAYMSPEHFFGEPVDHRTDIYALGVILYETLTGRTPLAAENIGNFAEELRYLDPTPPSKVAPGAGIPADVDYLVLRALAKKPEERFASMRELGVALAEAREDSARAAAASAVSR